MSASSSCDTYEEYGQSFAHQDAFFDLMFKIRRMAAFWVDKGGMGEKVVEDAIARHGSRVHGELLVGPARHDIAMSLKQRFQERRIRIRRDAITRADLMAIKRIGSEASGGIRIVNDGTVHADRFWAYGLASRAADLPMLTYDGFRSVGGANRDRRPGDDDDDMRLGRGNRMGGIRGAY